MTFQINASIALIEAVAPSLDDIISENQRNLISILSRQQESIVFEASSPDIPDELLEVSAGFRVLFRAQQRLLVVNERLLHFRSALEDGRVSSDVLTQFLELGPLWDKRGEDQIHEFALEDLGSFLSRSDVLRLSQEYDTEAPSKAAQLDTGGLSDVDSASPEDADFIRTDAVPDDEDLSDARWETEDQEGG